MVNLSSAQQVLNVQQSIYLSSYFPATLRNIFFYPALYLHWHGSYFALCDCVDGWKDVNTAVGLRAAKNFPASSYSIPVFTCLVPPEHAQSTASRFKAVYFQLYDTYNNGGYFV